MKETWLVILAVIAGGWLTDLLAEEAHSSFRQSDAVRLIDMEGTEKVTQVTLRNEVAHVRVDMRSQDFFGRYTVFAIPMITNLLGRELYVSYSASFYDANEQLVCAIHQGFTIAADASGFQLASAMAAVPKAAAESIRSYRIAIYCMFSTDDSGNAP
jgi:hypothetical protein